MDIKICQNEASAHLLIDAYFFPIATMVNSTTPTMALVLNVEHQFASQFFHLFTSTTLSGLIDYTAVIASRHNIGEWIVFQCDQLVTDYN